MIDTAVLLAAGEGSRLRTASPLKPLCPVAGRPLLDHALYGLAEAGLRRAVVVTGYGADAVEAHLAAGCWPLRVETVRTPDWRLPNGVSALAAEPLVTGEVLLAMCDHLVEPALYARVADVGSGGGLCLGIDRRLGRAEVDPADVTRVATDGQRIVAIGKGLDPYDAYDTGVFAITPILFDILAGLPAPSLTEGVRALAGMGRAWAVDTGDLDWVDVDDAAALEFAERLAG